MPPRSIRPDDYVHVTTGADLAGVSRYWMRQLVQNGKIDGFEIDGFCFVLRAAAEHFDRHPSAGRPRNDAPPKAKRARRKS